MARRTTRHFPPRCTRPEQALPPACRALALSPGDLKAPRERLLSASRIPRFLAACLKVAPEAAGAGPQSACAPHSLNRPGPTKTGLSRQGKELRAGSARHEIGFAAH